MRALLRVGVTGRLGSNLEKDLEVCRGCGRLPPVCVDGFMEPVTSEKNRISGMSFTWEIPELEAQLTCISGQVLAAKGISRVIIKLVGKDCKRPGQ